MKQFIRPEFNLLKEEKSTSYGEFMVEPLERGFGTTLGNALRRTLLAATPGAAVYAIRLKGANHEFTSLPGIEENVSRIVLNIKQLILKIDTKMYGDETVELKINSTTAGPVTAKDIDLPAGVEVLNPELVLATLADGGVLDLTLFARNGRGYRSFKDNKEEVKEVGLITIDSNYSPILKVAYRVEPTKIGRSIDLEKLILEVTTDGSLTPVAAISVAAKVLAAHLEYFINLDAEINDLEVIGTEEEEDQELDQGIDDLDLTQRSLNCLKRAGIETLRDLISRSEDEIQEIRNLGRKSFKEIKDRVASLNLNFKQV